MLDKTIPYYHVLMKREEGKPLCRFMLPAQYKFTVFKSGDEKEWAEIEALKKYLTFIT